MDGREQRIILAGLLVHEWIEQRGGSERVLDAVAETFTDADILCLWNDNPEAYRGRQVEETWLSRTPLRRSKPLALPLMIPTWRRRKDNDYEWMFVSSHLFAHHISLATTRDVPKFVYVHTPARYIWTPELDERGNGVLTRVVSRTLRGMDRKRAGEATSLAANSHFVQKRIFTTWGLEAKVIHPPVDTAELSSVADWATMLTDDELARVQSLPSEFILGASRFVPYKRLDLVIEAGEASGLPVVLAGSGPLWGDLEKRGAEATVPIHIIQNPSDSLIRYLYQKALTYVFPPVEDFGIMPVEAMALGTPVVANSVGGASESVVDGKTGALVTRFNREELRAAVLAAASLSGEDCIHRAKVFSKERFQDEVRTWVGASSE